MLEAFGVEHQVESVYMALVDHPAADIHEIAGYLSISEDEIHRSLDTLAGLSLVRWQEPGQRAIHLIRPDIALSYLVAREHARLLARQHQVEISRLAIATLIAKLSEERSPQPDRVALEQVFGIEHIRAKIAELAYGTRVQVLSMMPDGPQTEANLEASRPLDEMLLRRGVQLLTLYLDSVRNDAMNRQYIRWLEELGGEVRTATMLPLRLLVFDRRTAVVPLNPGHTDMGVAVVQGTGPVAAMSALFDELWATSEPPGEPRSMPAEATLTAQELAVVRLLARGDTDVAISRRLGVSVRTAGRIASDIMTKAGAKSRFQAGLRIGELGWHLLPAGNSRTQETPAE